MKKLICALILGAGVTTGYAIEDLTYSMSSSGNGDVIVTVQNTTVQRIVLNKLVIKNSNNADCLVGKDFIIEPHGEAIMSPFNQFKCFGLDKNLTLDSADYKTKDQKAGNVKEDIRIQAYYTRGYQPDPYAPDHSFSLFFK